MVNVKENLERWNKKKGWLNRGGESNTYLTHVCTSLHSIESLEKIENRSIQPTLWPMKATTQAESFCFLKTFYALQQYADMNHSFLPYRYKRKTWKGKMIKNMLTRRTPTWLLLVADEGCSAGWKLHILSTFIAIRGFQECLLIVAR